MKPATQTLIKACSMGDGVELVRKILNRNREELNQIDKTTGCRPIHIACAHGNINIVKFLLEQKDINLDKISKEKFTLLHIACYERQKEIVQLLIDKNFDPNDVDNEGFTPFHFACEKGDADIVEMLVQNKNVDVNKRDFQGMTPFYLACNCGNEKVVKILLGSARVDPNITSNKGNHPIVIASSFGHHNIVQALLQNKRITLKDNSLNDALFIACQEGHLETAKLLLTNNNSNPNKIDEEGSSVLGIACSNGRVDIVGLLLNDKRLIPEYKIKGQFNALHVACVYGEMEVARVLIANGRIGLFDILPIGTAPIHFACELGEVGILNIMTSSSNFDLFKKSEFKNGDRHLNINILTYALFLRNENVIDVFNKYITKNVGKIDLKLLISDTLLQVESFKEGNPSFVADMFNVSKSRPYFLESLKENLESRLEIQKKLPNFDAETAKLKDLILYLENIISPKKESLPTTALGEKQGSDDKSSAAELSAPELSTTKADVRKMKHSKSNTINPPDSHNSSIHSIPLNSLPLKPKNTPSFFKTTSDDSKKFLFKSKTNPKPETVKLCIQIRDKDVEIEAVNIKNHYGIPTNNYMYANYFSKNNKEELSQFDKIIAEPCICYNNDGIKILIPGQLMEMKLMEKDIRIINSRKPTVFTLDNSQKANLFIFDSVVNHKAVSRAARTQQKLGEPYPSSSVSKATGDKVRKVSQLGME